MASYDDPDQWIKTSQIPWGTDKTKTQSIQDSWTETNRAAFGALGVVTAIAAAIIDLPGKVADAIANRRWFYGNQQDVPDAKKGTNNIFEATEASNTLLFGPSGLAALHKKVDALAAKIDAQSKPSA